VYRALAVQNDLPFLEVDPRGVSRRVARTIPARLARSLRVLPVCVQEGAVEVATTEVPSEEVWREVGEHFPAPVHFRLVTPDNFAALVEEFL
jgi:predicted lipid carrier protein YhbT